MAQLNRYETVMKQNKMFSIYRYSIHKIAVRYETAFNIVEFNIDSFNVIGNPYMLFPIRPNLLEPISPTALMQV